MADIGINRNYLVEPNRDVKVKWLEIQIQERKSRVVRLRQDIEDITKGRIVELEAQMIIANNELIKLESDKKLLETSIDVQAL